MPAASATKRKSDASDAGSSRAKRAKKTAAPDFSAAQTLIDTLLDADDDDEEPELSIADMRKIAEYARHLESEVAASKPKEKSGAEIAAAAEKLRSACVSGIKKQMSWKPSCKTGGAKWAYDGVCTDPTIFGSMLNISGAPRWKAHKYTVAEFEEVMGSIEASVRYDTLELMGNVNVRYQPDEGTFKMSGTYGAPRHVNK
ncbi:hypothetical protein FB45DRAFT_1131096 [Roridomyces roridus]|uniref:Uncharacterized protein n=1 Tax=Roridomyces roridus TaxID=1738132 RepID=A0AAD7B2C7_9AGAR|nr:hypothetical protein FB45DRAFT_1131096 [Roridomyces roridus]